VLALKLDWFPAQGSSYNTAVTGFQAMIERIHHLILPGITIGLASTASYMGYMRSEVLDVLSSNYIRTARAKGMSQRNVLYKHTLRNAIIPNNTVMDFELGR